MSFDRMIEKIVETQNPTVAGLDPKLAYIPSYILDGAVAKYGKRWRLRPPHYSNTTRASSTRCAILSRP